MQLSARILTALAVLTLLVAYVAGGGASPSVEAATGVIDVLNVGTCYATTTDDEVFSASNCDDANNDNDDDGDGYDVGGRKVITQADNVYATYAVDPKTSAEAPRAILTDSDLIRIVIQDKGRDKRTGVLYPVNALTNQLDGDSDPGTPDTYETDWKQIVENKTGEPDTFTPITTGATFDSGTINNSGEVTFRLSGTGDTDNPLAPDGKVYWFGFRIDTTDDSVIASSVGAFSSNNIDLDEDKSQGDNGIPWIRASVSVAEGQRLDIKFIYYETSDREVLEGGDKYLTINGDVDADALAAHLLRYPDPLDRPDIDDAADVGPLVAPTDPEYTSDEQKADGKALVVEARADGDKESVNLVLRETNKFSGQYAGYLRLTDADGDGSEHCEAVDANGDRLPKTNWGREVCDADTLEVGDTVDPATIGTVAGAAVLGVQSGPVKIRYRDSDGDTQEVEILIDTGSPTIQIVSPEHKSSGRDDSPIVDGSFADGESGLRADSFRIYGDNTADTAEDGNKGTPVFKLDVRDSMPENSEIDGNGTRGVVVPGPDGEATASEDKTVELRGHYVGYSATNSETFGIIPASDIYFDNDRTAEGETDADNIEDEVKQALADDFEDGDQSGTFDSTIRFDYKTGSDKYNNAVDIQAVVMDIAGNIGFSDSDPSAPTFIHDFGTKKGDRKAEQHNVLGWYSRHIYHLDEVNPTFQTDESATGFFGEDDDDEAMMSKSGLMVVFDGNVDANSVSTDTFAVTLDGGDTATVTDVAVEGRRVYLMLDTELEPDATPQVEIASGETIEDLAGNESSFRDEEVEKFELSDGILPALTITLSGGSGLNEGSEGPDQLTKDNMTITITSDERLQGAPKFAVVCSSLAWDSDDDGPETDEGNNADKYASNRSGAMTNDEYGDAEPLPYSTTSLDGSNTHDRQITCGYDPAEGAAPGSASATNNNKKRFVITETAALARPGNTWEYQWTNLSGDTIKVEDGKLTVVATGRDRSSYKRGMGDTATTIFNRASTTAEFTFDNTFLSPLDDDAKSAGGEVIPGKGESVTEPRPFVLLDFGHEKTSVDVTMMKVDGEDVVDQLRDLDDNRFVYWPESLDYGSYSVQVEANDAANKSLEFNYSFSVSERTPFGLNLLAGWNAISFPANPEDRTINAVFTLPEIDQVIGWDPTDPSPWRMATKIEGVWTTNQNDAPLNDVQARYGYWVHSTSFVTQYVTLVGKGDRENDGPPRPEDLVVQDGWNFVGVLDQDGDQTQSGAFGTGLRNSSQESVSAGDYLGDYTRAYTWDHTNNEWNVLRKDEFVSIGSGIWVYFTEGKHIAP